MTDLERTPPHDIQAEQSVLGGMMLSPSVAEEVSQLVRTPDFYRSAHQVIYTVLTDRLVQNEPVDAIATNAELVKRGESYRTGGPAYLHTLTETVPTAANAPYYAAIVADLALKRRLVEVGTRVAQFGYTADGDAAELLEEATKLILGLDIRGTSDELVALEQVWEEAVDHVEKIARGEVEKGLMTGFIDFDRLVGGLKPSQLVIIGARPGMGKSTLALDVARHVAIHSGVPTLFFSQEMGRRDLGIRLISAETKVTLHSLNNGFANDEAWKRIADHSGARYAPLWIDDVPRTIGQLTAIIRKAVRKLGVKLVIVDYLQLVGSDGRTANREQEIAHITRTLKLTAMSLGVTIVALSQLNRKSEDRPDKRPQVSDLRESGAAEQDADMVILIYREDYHDKESPRSGEADLIIAKHRNGPTAELPVAFQGHYSRFVDMASGH